jgi:hypothetical protein
MPSVENTRNQPDEVTLALWRAAEAGELHEVELLLSRVADLNARNEHGVTALMRAAQHGHAWVVRLLLAKGADANVVRNDKFTALSLAAFFGHTEVVRALMEHGADSKASTRQETSPHMWATARTFNEVVDQLKTPAAPKSEGRAPAVRTEAPPKAPRPVSPVAAAVAVNARVTSAIVRTLKEPPEIWDLVHEEPKGFNARSAFVGHLRSMRLTFRIATAACLLGACIVGVWVLRGVQARSEVTAQQQLDRPAAAVPVQNEAQNENKTFENRSSEALGPLPAAGAASEFVAPPVPIVTTESSSAATMRRRSSHSRMVRAPEVQLDQPAQPPPIVSVQPGATPSEKMEVRPRPTSSSTIKSSSALSPQLITPAKNASTKSKVIQWP